MKKDNSAKHSLTKNQSLVMQALAEADQPLGAYELLNRLQPSGFKAPLQVYRALDQLVEKGLVHRLESLNAWTACCEDQHGYTPVFAICATAAMSPNILTNSLPAISRKSPSAVASRKPIDH